MMTFRVRGMEVDHVGMLACDGVRLELGHAQQIGQDAVSVLVRRNEQITEFAKNGNRHLILAIRQFIPHMETIESFPAVFGH